MSCFTSLTMKTNGLAPPAATRKGVPLSKLKEAGAKPSRRRGLSALVLAAGESSRFRGTKQLAKIGEKTLVQVVLDAITKTEVADIVVVLGHESQRVQRAIEGREGVRVVVNPDYRDGMGTSIRTGMLSLAKDTDGVMLLLADQPFVTRSLMRRIIRAFEAGRREGRIVAAAHGDLVTPPVIFPRMCFGELSRLRGDKGAKSVIERHAGGLHKVQVGSKGALADIDTKKDLQAARRLLEP